MDTGNPVHSRNLHGHPGVIETKAYISQYGVQHTGAVRYLWGLGHGCVNRKIIRGIIRHLMQGQIRILNIKGIVGVSRIYDCGSVTVPIGCPAGTPV